MKANELPIINFLQSPNVQFVIPVYQRNYDWTIRECRELIKDIISVETEKRGTHFIGSIVFIHEGTYSTSEVKELVIIDGQQRLTTINILYVALYRFAQENGLQQESERLYNMFLTNQYVKKESSKLKLKQTDTNSLAFKAILLGNEKEFSTYSNVIENYNFFRSIISLENLETILNGLSRLIFVEISLERGKDDPQRIFESLNSTGLELSQSDLIRNFILMDLEPKEQFRIFNQYWNPIESNARDLTRQRSLVSDFIRDYLTLKNKKIPNKSKVYDEFKRLYANNKGEAFYQDLENIKSLSVHYKKLVNPSTVENPKIRKELKYIKRLEINVAYPFLLQVLEDYDNGVLDSKELISILKLIQSYTWRRFVAGTPTNALNRIFMTLYSEVDVDEYFDSIARALIKKKGTGKFPTNEEIKSSLKDKDLYNTQSKNRNYLFELLENYNNREYVDTSHENITIEHIFPQTPHKDWEQELSSEEYFIFREKYLNTIANLTLSGNNGSLGNKTFLSKKVMNQNDGEQGYNYSRLWLNSYLKTIDSWNLDTYEERFELIYQRFLNIWEFPDVIIEEVEDTEEQNIFDAESPTNKKLEYFIFEDSKVDERHIAGMYTYVLAELYERNTQLLLDNNEMIKVSRNVDEFRSPQELINGYYIEMNIDSNSKFTVLKKLLTVYDLVDELTIKYEQIDIAKSKYRRFSIRNEFWTQLLPKIENTELFDNVKPTTGSWISTGAGISGVSYTFSVTGKYARIELSIVASSKETNKLYFNQIYNNKSAVEARFKDSLVWEELPDNKMSRIKYEMQGVSLFDKEDWDKMASFLIENLPKFEKALKPEIDKLKA